MAISPGLSGVQVTIRSDKKVLSEYLDEGEWSYQKFGDLPKGKRTASYVECLSDLPFEVYLEFEDSFKIDTESVSVMVAVDGRRAASKTVFPDHLLQSNGVYKVRLGSYVERISATEISRQGFRFGSIKKVDSADSDRIKDDVQRAKELSTIVVMIYRSFSGAMQQVRASYAQTGSSAPTEIAEKALKGQALSHGVQYGPRQTFQAPLGAGVKYTDGDANPIAVFLFKYRSKEALKSELIIPRSPSHEIHDGNDDNLGESRDERLARLKREINIIKAEDGENGLGKRKRAEADVDQRTGKTSRNDAAIDFVDLTEDD